MAYWQMASGDGSIDLEELFLQQNVALMGPGDFEDYYTHKEQYLQREDGYLLKRFCEDVQVGDILVLRRLLNPHTHFYWEIRAVGTVVGPYRYEPTLAHTIEGRLLPHCRPVTWQSPPMPTIVVGGGAHVKIQRLEDDNPLKLKAEELCKNTNK